VERRFNHLKIQVPQFDFILVFGGIGVMFSRTKGSSNRPVETFRFVSVKQGKIEFIHENGNLVNSFEVFKAFNVS
jgi:hypothetical protein